jgi:hypothetical protein
VVVGLSIGCEMRSLDVLQSQSNDGEGVYGECIVQEDGSHEDGS